jgi:hypothetical protein
LTRLTAVTTAIQTTTAATKASGLPGISHMRSGCSSKTIAAMNAQPFQFDGVAP